MSTPHEQAAAAKDRAYTIGGALKAATALAIAYNGDDPLATLEIIVDRVVEIHVEQQAKYGLAVELGAEPYVADNVVPFTGAAAQLAQAVDPYPTAPSVGGNVVDPNAHQQPQGAYAPGPAPVVQQAPAPIPGAAPTLDFLWRDFIGNPNGWFDNRADKASGKTNAKAPDFKSKNIQDGSGNTMRNGKPYMAGLYVDDKKNPDWVEAELRRLGYVR